MGPSATAPPWEIKVKFMGKVITKLTGIAPRLLNWSVVVSSSWSFLLIWLLSFWSRNLPSGGFVYAHRHREAEVWRDNSVQEFTESDKEKKHGHSKTRLKKGKDHTLHTPLPTFVSGGCFVPWLFCLNHPFLNKSGGARHPHPKFCNDTIEVLSTSKDSWEDGFIKRGTLNC